MPKAEEKFIKNRSTILNYRIESVTTENTSTGTANTCLKNAFDVNLLGNGKIISGWLVKKTNEENNSCVIHPHFWNIDRLDNYFDTTPLENGIFTYIIDQELAIYGQKNLELLRSLVCYSLIQCGDEYTAFEIIQGKDVRHKITDLSNSNVFKFKQSISTQQLPISPQL